MDRILFGLGALTLAGFVIVFAQLVLGGRTIRRLADVPPLADEAMPAVSIVVAARNEERGITAGLRSLLAQDAPRLEVVAVDDRSDDATGAIMDRLAAAEPRLRVLHVTALPRGWLGKNHALWLGASAAAGELILFTDADVVMAPDTLRRAAAYLREHRLDHLTAAMHVDMPGWLLSAFGVTFGVMFVLFTRPWKARDPGARAHVGIGAFNLIRADAYRRIGTHRTIAMRPDDDMKLGKLVKKNGLRQDLVSAVDHVRVEWYHSVGEAVRGLRKNGFAGLDYRLWLVAAATVMQLVFFVFPFAGVFIAHGWGRAFYAGADALLLAIFAGAAREQRASPWLAFAFPLCSLLLLFVIWNATVHALVHRGIEWRGTHYPLDELKANRV